jgi:hypothetical protein
MGIEYDTHKYEYKKGFWNYFDYIGRRTNNGLEVFNRQLKSIST